MHNLVSISNFAAIPRVGRMHKRNARIYFDRPLYWLNPLLISSVVFAMSMICYIAVPEGVFLAEFRQPKYGVAAVVPVYGYVWFALTLGLLTARYVTPSLPKRAVRIDTSGMQPSPIIKNISRIALVLSLLAYAIYIGSSSISVSVFLSAASGTPKAIYELKGSFEKTPGITSFMNLAPWWFVYVGYQRLVRRVPLKKWEVACTILLLALSVFRGFAVNERRVIFELFVPAAVVVLLSRRSWSHRVGTLLKWAPLLGLLMLCTVFVATEYFRTWVSFWRDSTSLPYLEWALVRLAGYYATACNNGYALLSSGLESHGMLTFGAISKIPLLGELFAPIEERMAFSEDVQWSLERLTNPEFNNPGGMIVPLIDFGWALGGLIIFLAGALIGITHRLAIQGSMHALLFYVLMFFALLESTRVIALTSPSSLLNFVFLFLVMVFQRTGTVTRRPARALTSDLRTGSLNTVGVRNL